MENFSEILFGSLSSFCTFYTNGLAKSCPAPRAIRFILLVRSNDRRLVTVLATLLVATSKKRFRGKLPISGGIAPDEITWTANCL